MLLVLKVIITAGLIIWLILSTTNLLLCKNGINIADLLLWFAVSIPLLWFFYFRRSKASWEKNSMRSRSKHKPARSLLQIPCLECNGSNICPDCKGTGIIKRKGQPDSICQACKGEGYCYRCKGRGVEKPA